MQRSAATLRGSASAAAAVLGPSGKRERMSSMACSFISSLSFCLTFYTIGTKETTISVLSSGLG